MNDKQSVLRHMRNHVMKSGEGKVYVLSDFVEYGDYESIKKSLQRLNNESVLRRVKSGVYERPKYNSILNRYVSASADQVAQAIARSNSWTIIPAGDKGLNMLGLSTQVPAKSIYISDGPTKKYTYGNQEIQFKHVTLKHVSGLSPKTALVIEALRMLGKENVTDSVINRLSEFFSTDEKNALVNETKNSTLWIREIIAKVAAHGGID